MCASLADKMESEEEGARCFFKERREREEEEGQEDQEEDQEGQEEQEEQQEQQAVVEELESISPPNPPSSIGLWSRPVRPASSTPGAFAVTPSLSDVPRRFDRTIRHDGAESPDKIGDLDVNIPVAKAVGQDLGEHESNADGTVMGLSAPYPFHRRTFSACGRRWNILLAVMAVILLAIFVMISVTANIYTCLPLASGVSTNPTFDRLHELLSPLYKKSSLHLLFDQTAPQGRALQWLSENDKAYVDGLFESAIGVDDSNLTKAVLIQRFTLAVFYYSTGGENWLNQCGFLREGIDECFWSARLDGARLSYFGVSCDTNTKGAVATMLGISEFRGKFHRFQLR